MSKYQDLAKSIISLIGGKKNVVSATHCATRLRFKLRDDSIAKVDELKALEGVVTVINSGGMLQVVIGSHVADVYAAVNAEVGEVETIKAEVKGKFGDRILEVVSGAFSPLIGALAGAGLIKALVTVCGQLGMDTSVGTFTILSGAADAVFYFLPIFLGYTLSKKLGSNPYLGAIIGAALVHPTIIGLAAGTTFVGIPVVLGSYTGSVFPMFLAIPAAAWFEKLLKGIIPHSIRFVVLPFILFIVIVPLVLLVLGPFGLYVGKVVSTVIGAIAGFSGLLLGIVMAVSWLFLVFLGLHWALVPIFIANFAASGDPMIATVGASIFAQAGVALAVGLKSKDEAEKALGTSSSLVGLIAGVTEPIIYGIIFKYKKVLLIEVIAAAIGGGIVGAFGVRQLSFFFPSLPAMSVQTSPMVYLVAGVISFVIAFGAVWVLGYKDKKIS